MKERRRYKRFLVGEMGIEAKTVFSTEIEILDISIGGARIKGTKSLKIGSQYMMKLERDDIMLPLKGTVIWENLSGSIKNDEGETIPVYTAGIRFENIFSEKLLNLIDFIDNSAVSKENRLSGLRFKIYANEKVILNYKETYPVKKISFGGMCVETNCEFPVEGRFPMEIFLPEEEYPIKFEGRIASCLAVEGEKSQCYDIGIEFMDILEHDRLKLAHFIELLTSFEIY